MSHVDHLNSPRLVPLGILSHVGRGVDTTLGVLTTDVTLVPG